MKSLIKLFIIFIMMMNAQAQSKLEQYILEGIEKNIVLQQKKISYEKAITALHIATSYFFPSLNLQANYTSGEGGRSIAIPVGDMMNPAYQTLNQLTGSNSFPQISNVKENLFPYKFYDVKIRTAMPLINTDLIFNRKIQSGQTQLKKHEVEMYKRELVKEIKVAYFNSLSAESAVKIYENALLLAHEGKRVNESLLKNGTGLHVYLLRSESEIEQITAQKIEAENQLSNTKQYFNFLLNKNLDAEVVLDLAGEYENLLLKGQSVVDVSLSKREEILMLRQAIDINNSVVKMKKFYWIPKVNVFMDLGAQDQKWKYNQHSRYYLFGFQLDVPIFESFRNQYQIDEAELGLRDAELNYKNIGSQLRLSANVAANAVITANQKYQSALKQFEAAKSYHKLVMKGYQEGIDTFIETIDARTLLLTSEMLVNINRNNVLIAKANYERELAINEIN